MVSRKMKRRGNNEGSIYKRADGRYVGRYYITQPNGIRKRCSVYGKDRETANELMQKAILAAKDGQSSISNSMSLTDFYNYWKKEKASEYLAATTIELYDDKFNRYILPILGKKKLSKIDTMCVQKLISSVKVKTNCSPRQCDMCKVALSSVLRTALELHLIAYNYAHGVRTPKYEAKEKVLWSKDELNRFLLYAKENDSMYPIYLLLARYGLRAGEGLGIRYEDVELGGPSENSYGTIHIRQQIVTLNGQPVEASLKTKNSKRDLPITKEIYEVLSDYMDKNRQSGLIFHTASGKAIERCCLGQRFNRSQKRAGLQHITLHTLRHMAATTFRDADVDVKTAQMLLGHADPTTTLRIYQHSNMENKTDAMQRVEQFCMA